MWAASMRDIVFHYCVHVAMQDKLRLGPILGEGSYGELQEAHLEGVESPLAVKWLKVRWHASVQSRLTTSTCERQECLLSPPVSERH